MNRIKDPTKVPNAGSHGVGFIYKDRDSGKIFVHAVVEQVIFMARKHRAANNYPISSEFNQSVIDNICSNQPELCWDEPAPSLGEKLGNLARAIYQSARGGFKTLSPEEVQDRQKACETSGAGGGACEYFKGFSGLLGVYCGKCGCSKLKIHLKTSTCPLSKWPDL